MLNCVTLKDMFKSQPPVPQNATLVGSWAVALVKSRWGHTEVGRALNPIGLMSLEEDDVKTQEERIPQMMEAETGVMHLSAKKYQGLPVATRNCCCCC